MNHKLVLNFLFLITPIIVGLSVYLAPDKDRLLYTILSFLIMCIVNLIFFFVYKEKIITKNKEKRIASKTEMIISYSFFIGINVYMLLGGYFLPAYLVFFGIVLLGTLWLFTDNYLKNKSLN